MLASMDQWTLRWRQDRVISSHGNRSKRARGHCEISISSHARNNKDTMRTSQDIYLPRAAHDVCIISHAYKRTGRSIGDIASAIVLSSLTSHSSLIMKLLHISIHAAERGDWKILFTPKAFISWQTFFLVLYYLRDTISKQYPIPGYIFYDLLIASDKQNINSHITFHRVPMWWAWGVMTRQSIHKRGFPLKTSICS
jgi:hypothetical protein